jgi:hypothetical protein
MGFFDSGISEGLNQTTGNMVNMGMQLYQHKAQQAIQQERLSVEQETATRRNKLLDMQIAQQQDDVKLIDVDDQLDRLGFKSKAQKDWWYSQPDIQLDIEEFGGRKTLQKKKAIEHFMNVAKSPEKNIELGNIRLNEYTEGIDGITKQLSDPESKLKPEQVDALNKQLEGLKQARINTINHVKLEQLKIKGGRLINVPQGTKTIDPITGETVADNPKEEEGLVVVGHDVLDKKTRKRVYRAPFAPTSSSQEPGKLTDIQKKRIDVLSSGIKNIDDQMKNTLAKDKPTLEAKRVKLEKERNDLLGVKTQEQPTFAQKPDASKYKGKIIVDTVTGKKEKSDGKKWVEIK